MCLDERLLPHKLVNMNMNQKDKVFQNSELNFHREKEPVSSNLVTSVKASRTLTQGFDQGFDQDQI